MATVLSSHTAVDIDFFLGQELEGSCIWAVDLLVKNGGKTWAPFTLKFS